MAVRIGDHGRYRAMFVTLQGRCSNMRRSRTRASRGKTERPAVSLSQPVNCISITSIEPADTEVCHRITCKQRFREGWRTIATRHSPFAVLQRLLASIWRRRFTARRTRCGITTFRGQPWRYRPLTAHPGIREGDSLRFTILPEKSAAVYRAQITTLPCVVPNVGVIQ